MIAGPTVYDVYGIRANYQTGFRLQVNERLVRTIRFNGYRDDERTQTQSTQA